MRTSGFVRVVLVDGVPTLDLVVEHVSDLHDGADLRRMVMKDAPPLPPNYVRLASTTQAEQLERVCTCNHCQADGPHAPSCATHGSAENPDVDGPCDCGRRPAS